MDIDAVDLTAAVERTIALTQTLGQPTVVVGALALAAYGYRRETSDVDIILPVVIGAGSGDAVEVVARELGLTVRARHSFGGLDLRAGTVRIDVLTLNRDMPTLIPEAVRAAVTQNIRLRLFGYDVYVVPIGHLVTMKMMAERRKDAADVVELIKARMSAGAWQGEAPTVRETVKRHLGWYAVRVLGDYEATAAREL